MSHTCRVSTPYTSFPPHTHTLSLLPHSAAPGCRHRLLCASSARHPTHLRPAGLLRDVLVLCPHSFFCDLAESCMHADGGGGGADVWACGVLLFVMLLGAFPFEHSTSSATDEQRAFNEVHFEQIRIHWTENERNRDIVQVPPPTNSSCVL